MIEQTNIKKEEKNNKEIKKIYYALKVGSMIF